LDSYLKNVGIYSPISLTLQVQKYIFGSIEMKLHRNVVVHVGFEMFKMVVVAMVTMTDSGSKKNVL
jgi:hypothetical protein